MAKVRTLKDVEVLQMKNNEVGVVISGGVSLNALVTRLQGGDARALSELVMQTRPSANTLSWGFKMAIEAGRLKGVVLPSGLTDPSQIIPLFEQALFLRQKKHYDAAIEVYGKVLQLSPNYTEAYYNRGNAYYHKGDYDCAIADFDQALRAYRLPGN